MREKLIRFMQGRYGMDALGKCTMTATIVCAVLTWFVHNRLLSLLVWALLILTYFRMFSRNVYKRAAENRVYLERTYKLRCFFARQKNMLAQRKTHHIYKCPSCGQKIRIPRGKGRIEIRCPKCSATFIKKS